ncbi:hypothetical protein TNCV_897081 [Trichonephila clavipes]|nr:hypothetical protein TNCV_897081 [Trichonephila clavipes]
MGQKKLLSKITTKSRLADLTEAFHGTPNVLEDYPRQSCGSSRPPRWARPHSLRNPELKISNACIENRSSVIVRIPATEGRVRDMQGIFENSMLAPPFVELSWPHSLRNAVLTRNENSLRRKDIPIGNEQIRKTPVT